MQVTPGHLTLEQLHAIHRGGAPLKLPAAAGEAIRASARVVQRAAEGDAPVYGVNTGFGKLANQRISASQLDTLQLNLIRSHSVGVGEPLAPPVVRLKSPTGKPPRLPIAFRGDEISNGRIGRIRWVVEMWPEEKSLTATLSSSVRLVDTPSIPLPASARLPGMAPFTAAPTAPASSP